MGATKPPEELEPHQILEQHLPNVSPITQIAMRRAIEEHERLKRLYENLAEERTMDLLEKERMRGLAAVVDAINGLADAVRAPLVQVIKTSGNLETLVARPTEAPAPAPPQAQPEAPAVDEPHAEGANGSARSVR